MNFAPADHPRRRRNLLTGDWVLVSPHRAKRPWQGEQTPPAADLSPSYDPTCYLCPGNARVSGERNPAYERTFTFIDDFAALLPDTPASLTGDELLPIAPARGEARVICFSPDHAATLPDLSAVGMRAVVEAWCARSAEPFARWDDVRVFANKGAMMGCSNPHRAANCLMSEPIIRMPGRALTHTKSGQTRPSRHFRA